MSDSEISDSMLQLANKSEVIEFLSSLIRKEEEMLTISNLGGNGLRLWPRGVLEKPFCQLCPAER